MQLPHRPKTPTILRKANSKMLLDQPNHLWPFILILGRTEAHATSCLFVNPHFLINRRGAKLSTIFFVLLVSSSVATQVQFITLPW